MGKPGSLTAKLSPSALAVTAQTSKKTTSDKRPRGQRVRLSLPPGRSHCGQLRAWRWGSTGNTRDMHPQRSPALTEHPMTTISHIDYNAPALSDEVCQRCRGKRASAVVVVLHFRCSEGIHGAPHKLIATLVAACWKKQKKKTARHGKRPNTHTESHPTQEPVRTHTNNGETQSSRP